MVIILQELRLKSTALSGDEVQNARVAICLERPEQPVDSPVDYRIYAIPQLNADAPVAAQEKARPGNIHGSSP